MGINKKCSKCLKTKSIAYFYKQKCGKLGRTAECKDCRKKRTDLWTEDNREKKNLAGRKRYKEIDRTEYNRKWREENPLYFKEYYKQNREIRLEANKRFWKRHPERYKAQNIYSYAKRKGVLIKPNQCQICGAKHLKIHGHHFDYTQPLAVTWVCVECHKEIHRKNKFTL